MGIKRAILGWILLGITGFSIGYVIIAGFRVRHREVQLVATPVSRRPIAVEEPDPQFIYKVELQDAPLRGPSDALVTVIEFSSFECPTCRAVDDSLHQLALADPSLVRIAWKDLPVSDRGRIAARALRSATRLGRFWDFYDALQKAPSTSMDEPSMMKIARNLGLEGDRFQPLLVDGALDIAIDSDEAQAHHFGLKTAPAVFVNGKFVKNPTRERLQEQIEEAKRFATQLIDQGTPREKIYSALMRGALAGTGPITATPGLEGLVEQLK